MNQSRTTGGVEAARSQRRTSALVAGYIRELSQQDGSRPRRPARRRQGHQAIRSQPGRAA